jgi:ABC-type bacteriocin/lantibiotic exporter with double-glycine peptidase domain
MKYLYVNFILKNKLKFGFVCLISILIPIISNSIPYFSKHLLDGVLVPDNKVAIVSFVAVIIILNILKHIFTTTNQISVTKMNLSAISEIKKNVINDVINLPIVFHDINSSQYILSRINEVDSMSNLFSTELVSFIICVITAIVAAVLICYQSIAILVLAIITMSILFIAIKRAFIQMHNQVNDLMETSAQTSEDIYSNIHGAMTLKQFNNENEVIKKISSQIDILVAKNKTKSLTISKNSNLIMALVIVAQNLLIGLAALLINQGDLSLGSYLSISQYLALMYTPVLAYQSIVISLKPAIVAYNRLCEFYTKPDRVNKKITIASIDCVELVNLSFGYPNNPLVLKNINLKLYRGDKLLVTGANGSGKTTLSKILLGFYDNYQGSVQLDSIELRNINEANLRDKVSILPQKSYLFNLSIEENVRIADGNISDAEFAKTMSYFKKIGLFDGMDISAKVHDNGKNLSGGQIQRIALARLLLRDSDVCIFDEFYNSLDVHAVRAIETILQQEFNDKICIFIAHGDQLSNMCNGVLNLNRDDFTA